MLLQSADGKANQWPRRNGNGAGFDGGDVEWSEDLKV
jgi:hypothetical protein